jgi:hypothetical protein
MYTEEIKTCLGAIHTLVHNRQIDVRQKELADAEFEIKTRHFNEDFAIEKKRLMRALEDQPEAKKKLNDWLVEHNIVEDTVQG